MDRRSCLTSCRLVPSFLFLCEIALRTNENLSLRHSFKYSNPVNAYLVRYTFIFRSLLLFYSSIRVSNCWLYARKLFSIFPLCRGLWCFVASDIRRPYAARCHIVFVWGVELSMISTSGIKCSDWITLPSFSIPFLTFLLHNACRSSLSSLYAIDSTGHAREGKNKRVCHFFSYSHIS